MPEIRRDFLKGRMNLDVDSRLLPQGEYREATNVLIGNSDSNKEGVVQKSYSNRKLTNLSLGSNPITLGACTNEARDRIYWLVKSDSGCFLIEWDNTTQSASYVLADTRALGSRVFDLREASLCTGMDIIPSDDINKELLLLTDDNMQPLCINIERAKGYGVNGFDKEDIYLIKKPPRYEPTVQLTYTGGLENYMEEEFLTFSYRYKYLDGEYSAFSGFTSYNFATGPFELDYLTVENIAMLNTFNAVRIGFNTGDKRVTDIQLILKKSNSNIPYIVETFNKEMEGWEDDIDQSYIFSNNKTLVPLPTRELFRLYDNVPLKAKAQTVIGNKVIYGNYVEGYNIVDSSGRQIKMDYSVDLITNSLDGEVIDYDLQSIPEVEMIGSPTIEIHLDGFELNANTRITLDLSIVASQEDPPGNYIVKGLYNDKFDFILNDTYENAEELAASEEFILFINTVMTNVFLAEYEVEVPEDSTLTSTTPFSFTSSGNTITITAPTFTYTIGETSDTVLFTWGFIPESILIFRDFAVSSSIKTNRSYEVGIIYLDEFSRSTTVLTSKSNTVYIPQIFSTKQNKFSVTINNQAPVWANRYKLVVKQNPLTYYTIYGVLLYEDGPYRWVRLDGANKDKVKENDILILKTDQNGVRTDVFQVAVIELKQQEVNFISLNIDESNEEIIEEAGLYMKIKADGISAETTGNTFFQRSDTGVLSGVDDCRIEYFMCKPDPENPGQYIDIPIPAGSRIIIKFRTTDNDARYNITPLVYEHPFISQGSYDSFEDWFEAEFSGEGAIGAWLQLSVGRFPDNSIYLQLTKTQTFLGATYLSATVQLTSGLLIFETEPKNIETEIFYETGQSFNIEGGYHQGNIQNQNAVQPAVIDSNFFNCYAFGNGVESYRIKDLIHKNFLNIDLKPTATSVEGYKQIRRTADLTYSEAYVESSNINGLNVFNQSTGNYKELEKQGGSIQKLFARDGDIVVLQEEEAGKVLFDKTAIFTADGNAALSSIPGVLGQHITYRNGQGISKNPESFACDEEGRMYYTNSRKGTIVRLSGDGIEKIIYGVKNFFRRLFMDQPNAKKLGGYDPYHNFYTLSVGNEPIRVPVFGCGTNINKFDQTEAFTYEFQLNDLGGDIVLNYNITGGNATIEAEFNGTTEIVSNVTGIGSIVMERDSLVENIVTVTITPVSGAISYSMANSCPTGTALTIVSLVLNDGADTGQTMTDRFKWSGSPFFSTSELFTEPPVTRFESQTGIEGVGAFPTNGSLVNIQAFKDTINSGHFATSECNRLGYLISTTVYTEADYQDILVNPDTVFLTVTTTGEEGFSITNAANFVFNRTDPDEILYLIWDYTSRNPVISDDTESVTISGSVIIDVLANDEVSEDAVVTVATQPEHGTAVANLDNTITYTHDGTENLTDSFTYTVTEGGCSSTATVSITVGLSCGESLSASGGVGINEILVNFGTGIGFCGIELNAQSVPDRFELYWNDVKVADSLYIGDNISPGPPTSYPGLLGEKTLSVLEYNGSPTPPMFDDTGVDETFTIIQDDIADNVTTPTDGNIFLVFNKTTSFPVSALLRIIGPVGGTAFNINDIICPIPEEDLTDGEYKFVFGFFTEANKGNSTKSIKLYLGASPVKFYTNIFGYTNFNMFGEFSTNKYINDGTTWWQIDDTGNIVSTGSL